jgi:hypothetical protein
MPRTVKPPRGASSCNDRSRNDGMIVCSDGIEHGTESRSRVACSLFLIKPAAFLGTEAWRTTRVELRLVAVVPGLFHLLTMRFCRTYHRHIPSFQEWSFCASSCDARHAAWHAARSHTLLAAAVLALASGARLGLAQPQPSRGAPAAGGYRSCFGGEAEQHALYAARRGRGCGSAAADVRAFGLHGQEGAGV